MLIGASASVYGDELITATELNWQPGRVLDLAWERPVSITRCYDCQTNDFSAHLCFFA